MFDSLDNAGKIFAQAESLDLQPARAAVFSLRKDRPRKVPGECRLANAGRAMDDNDWRQFRGSADDLHLNFSLPGIITCSTRSFAGVSQPQMKSFRVIFLLALLQLAFDLFKELLVGDATAAQHFFHRVGDEELERRVGAHDSLPNRKSSAAPSGPEARPRESRQSARRIACGSAPCWTANENTIAESRALVSAELLLL